MEAVVLKVSKRAVTGSHSVKQVRREGAVPAVIYGRQAESRQVTVDKRLLQRFVRSHGTNGVVRLDIDGDTSTVALFKQIQLSPVGHEPLHIDFHAVVLDEAVKVQVALEFEGKPVGEDEGGTLNIAIRELEVECLPLSIPQFLVVDISGLNVNDAITAGDVPLPEGVVLACPATEPVCSLNVQSAGDEEAEAGEEAGKAADGDAGGE